MTVNNLQTCKHLFNRYMPVRPAVKFLIVLGGQYISSFNLSKMTGSFTWFLQETLLMRNIMSILFVHDNILLYTTIIDSFSKRSLKTLILHCFGYKLMVAFIEIFNFHFISNNHQRGFGFHMLKTYDLIYYFN